MALKQGRKLLPALFLSLAVFGTTEASSWALIVAIVIGVVVVALNESAHSTAKWGFAGASGLLVLWLGPMAMPLATFATLVPSLGIHGALASAAGVLLSAAWAPKTLLLTDELGPSAATAFALMVGPAICSLCLVANAPRQSRSAAFLKICCLSFAAVGVLWAAIAQEWVSTSFITSSATRCIVAVGFVMVCAFPLKVQLDRSERHMPACLIGGLCGAILALGVSLVGDPAETIVFDEAHGEWASTTLPLGPEDFGRSTTYSWTALAKFLQTCGYRVERSTEASRFVTPDRSSLFVMKMPTERIDEDYSRALLEWVTKGGRLLVVADHTDLFDTTQNLNAVLRSVGVSIASTAVFDRLGLPPVVWRVGWPSNTWIVDVAKTRYLTGASFAQLPWLSIPIHQYGMSFAEQAVYFNPNRFGYFHPSLRHPFGDHIAAALIPHGRGSIQVWLDSTHWSTFAVFQSAYQDAFLQAIERSRFGRWLFLYPIAVAALSLLFLMLVSKKLVSSAVMAGVSAGFLSLSVGLSALVKLAPLPSVQRGPIVQAAIGSSADVELLAPLVESASRNYARALTSLQKWSPVRMHVDASAAYNSSDPLLLLDMDAQSLPSTSQVIEWVTSGRRVVIVSDSRLLTPTAHQRWLRDLGIAIRFERGLSEERDSSTDLLARREVVRARRSVLRFYAIESGPWVETESTHFMQAFELRASSHRALRPGGALVLSSRSDQFSDAGMGDVWDGLPADDVSRARERSFAQMVLGEAVEAAGGRVVLKTGARQLTGTTVLALSRYLAASRGQVVAEGKLSQSTPGSELSLAETPDAFAWRLRAEVSAFIRSCTVDSSTGYCSNVFVDSRLIEWFVMPSVGREGRIERLELINDGRFSGVRDGLNVIFQ